LVGNIQSHDDNAIEKIGVKDINKQINLLGEEYKEPFEMHFEGFKYKEIADKLGIPIGTVKSRIFIARKKLMEALPEFAFSAN
jgi:RNA polymerase sigma-70 factor (ECF subfamily)